MSTLLVTCAWPVRHRRGAGRRAPVAVRAGRQGRGGRFPETPHASAHPLPLDDVCSAWRSGRSGADVVASWLALPTGSGDAPLYPLEAQFNPDCVASSVRRALPATVCSAAFPAARVLLTTVQPELEAAIALEARVASPGALALGDGIFAGPSPAPLSRLSRMLSLRAEFDPLVAAASSSELIAAVGAISWSAVEAFCDAGSHGLPDWRLTHERRGAATDRLPSPELVAEVRRAMHFASSGDDELLQASVTTAPLRFLVLETTRGFLFGLVTCAPAPSPALPSVWASKPHNYSAGLPLPLATLAVNLATGLDPSLKTVVDPCCGSGTLVFAAACLGTGSVAGVERQALLVQQAEENLAATAAVAAACCLQLSQAAASHECAPTVGGFDLLVQPQLLCADSNRVLFCSSADADRQPPTVCMQVLADTAEQLTAESVAVTTRRKLDAIVSNLPYGRMVGVAAATSPLGDRGLEALAPLLAWLRPQAERHAYFSGTRLAPMLRSLGFHDVDEVCVDVHGRRFLALASCGD